MTLIDLLIVLVFCVLVALAKVGVSAYSVGALVLVLIIARILLGERFPQRTA
jgi:hypothetical protein